MPDEDDISYMVHELAVLFKRLPDEVENRMSEGDFWKHLSFEARKNYIPKK